ncbi:MAG: helix-turn-helix domain-containing protein [Blastocatellia bacterium]
MAGKSESNPEQSIWTIERRRVSDFILTESACVKETVVPAHSHGESHVTVVLEGVCRETYLGRTRELAPMTVIYTTPGEPHSIRLFGDRFRTFDLELNNDWMARLLERPIAPTALLDAQSGLIAWLAARLYKEFRLMDELSPLAIEGLALEMMADLARSATRAGTKKAPHWLRQVVELIHDEFARSIPLSELATTAGVHPSHLAEVFRERYHCTPGEFIRQTRIKAAIRQMADPDLPLAGISLATGFSDQSHFSRVFK